MKQTHVYDLKGPPEIGELPDARIYLSVRGTDGKAVSAVVQPQLLTEETVKARINWNGNDVGVVIGDCVGDRSAWFQRFSLFSLGAGPEMALLVPELAAENWKLAKAVFPDIDGGPGDTVHLQLQRNSWDARLVLTRNGGSVVQTEIPPSLTNFSVGLLLGQMTSLMLLRKPWLRSS